LSKISQIHKDKYCMFSLIGRIRPKKKDKWHDCKMGALCRWKPVGVGRTKRVKVGGKYDQRALHVYMK
jgi:hypothetical protein